VLRAVGANPFATRPLAERRSHASYLCLMLPRLLGAEYGRILYLDADIHLERGDLGALLGVDLRGQAVGAVRDHKQWRTPGHRAQEFARLGWPAARYLNSGVLLLDATRYEAEGWLDRMVEIAGDPALARGYTRNDQSAINLALRGRWTELSPVWNWQFDRANRYAMSHAEPRLVHFIGSRKPWNDAARDLPPRFRARVHAFLSEHVPDHPALAGLDPVGRAEPRDLAKAYLTHWRRWRAMEAYLGRFPSETTTHAP
jgi:lipopolysaccharide biosynthesis glycosyltransferase